MSMHKINLSEEKLLNVQNFSAQWIKLVPEK